MATLDELVAALDAAESGSVSTSLRQAPSLRRALQVAVALGLAPNANDAANSAVRARVDAFAQRLALDEHYTSHPDARPALHEVAHALAVMDRHPLVERTDLLRQAQDEVLRHKADADADDVLLWAMSLLAHEPRKTRRRTSV